MEAIKSSLELVHKKDDRTLEGLCYKYKSWKERCSQKTLLKIWSLRGGQRECKEQIGECAREGETGGHDGVGLSRVMELILRTLRGGCKYWRMCWRGSWWKFLPDYVHFFGNLKSKSMVRYWGPEVSRERWYWAVVQGRGRLNNQGACVGSTEGHLRSVAMTENKPSTVLLCFSTQLGDCRCSFGRTLACPLGPVTVPLRTF